MLLPIHHRVHVVLALSVPAEARSRGKRSQGSRWIPKHSTSKAQCGVIRRRIRDSRDTSGEIVEARGGWWRVGSGASEWSGSEKMGRERLSRGGRGWGGMDCEWRSATASAIVGAIRLV